MDTPERDKQSLPAMRISDLERDAAIGRVTQAMVDGYLDFDEIDERFATISRARTEDELQRVVADLPELEVVAPIARQPMPTNSFSALGDLKQGGWIDVEPYNRVFSVIGDITIDLSTASFPPGGVVIEVWQVIGDVKVIVPDGARVQREMFTVIGDQREKLVPPNPVGPEITIKVRTVVGDAKVFSLSQVPLGLRAAWRKLRSGS